ncbi:hypothetical protein Godav_002375 [Gossypium davidsonii]|uniref:BHLH domain-containing protein n=2 Tax=Gossypium TaxID=3633 RepID=A0A7J8SVZ0_GOSDV|nr:hypothetical protein [Gossypium davidsonii]MBA0665971.1 hypothetical protein [Gossypium klotzschianum]
MSSRRWRESSRTNISEEQITQLLSTLRQLLPEIPQSHSHKASSAAKVLKQTCNYIKTLHREVDDLSDRLSQLLATLDADSAEAAIIRSLLI